MAPRAFYLVWSPAGLRPPRFRHTTRQSAVREAQRLSALNPEREFFVLRSLDVVVLTSQVMGDAEDAEDAEDDIPF